MEDDDDDIPRLPADTLKALQDFHSEKDARAKQFEALRTQSESRFDSTSTTKLSMDLFGEDWNASQFWYTDGTATTLARQLLAPSSPSSPPPLSIALVSAPSIYVALRNLLLSSSSSPDLPRPRLRLFEFDRRFEVLGPDFVFYDFREPLAFPAELRGGFDRIVCDPPFLSEDCQAKTAVTVRTLARRWGVPVTATAAEGEGEGEVTRIVACTGERMGETVTRLYAGAGVRTTTFEPEHAGGRLSNEFRCYANFEGEDWGWRETG